MEGRTTTHKHHVPRVSTTQYLIQFVKENVENQRPITNSAEHSLPPTDTTLDLSNKSIRELPIEVIEIIKDKVER